MQCGGNVHTALKRHAPLHLLIPRQQTKADSNTKIEDAMYRQHKLHASSIADPRGQMDGCVQGFAHRVGNFQGTFLFLMF